MEITNLSTPPLHPDRILAWSESRLEEPHVSERPGLLLWTPKGVVAAIGLAQNPDQELRLEAMEMDGVGLIRRQSGGGAVLLYPGVLCWEAWTPLAAVARDGGDDGIRRTYAFLSRPAEEGLRRIGLEVFRDGISDLSTSSPNGERKKIAGTAQLRRKSMALVHGSILVNSDVSLLGRYLKAPGDQPLYRRGRDHRDFCVSAAEKLELAGDDALALPARLAGEIAVAAAEMGWEVFSSRTVPDNANDPFRSKYRSAEWNWLALREAKHGGREG